MTRLSTFAISLFTLAAPAIVHAQAAPADAPASAPADAPATAPADSPAAPAPAAAADKPKWTSVRRETMIENALDTPAYTGSAFGGYGELTLNAPSNGDAVIDLRRFVIYFGHDFTDRIRFYSEFEVEHAVSSSTDGGEAEVEQAYLDGLFTRKLNLRGGLVLMPMGIVNVYHEPPSFNGVDRPDVDQFVIPTTWREPGVGIFGELAEGLRYQLYVVNGFNANGFSAQNAIREGHQEAQLAHAADVGAIGRIDYEPMLGTVIGFSAYGASAGNTLSSKIGHVPVGMFDIDARYHRGGFSARGEFAVLYIGDTVGLNQALLAGDDEQKVAGPVSARSQGAYAEVAYDMLRIFAPSSDQGLDLFTRFDYADTQADVKGGAVASGAFNRKSQMVGLVYRPIPQIALKFDYRRHWLGDDTSYNEFASAITYLF